MQIADKYAPQQIESKWYDYWIDRGIFHSEPDERKPYTIVIPPPNVTGMLHMGHMLNNTLQDVLVRRARMSGKNACWVPGMDHASIATEAKVVAMLREKGIEKSSLTREEFLLHGLVTAGDDGNHVVFAVEQFGDQVHVVHFEGFYLFFAHSIQIYNVAKVTFFQEFYFIFDRMLITLHP